MIDDKIKTIVLRRCKFQDEDYYGIEKCWIDLAEILRDDMAASLDYLLNRCTVNELSWLGDSFEYIAREIESEAFISCLYELADKEPIINQYGFLSFLDTEE